MYRKQHLKHTVRGGPTCQTGRQGAALRGEHESTGFADFVAHPEQQCERCKSSKLFAFLQKQASKVAA